MATMYGAPFGINAAEDQLNQNAESALRQAKAQAELGQVAGIEAHRAAQTRLAGAQADEQLELAAGHRATRADQAMMAQIEAQMLATKGRHATAEDLAKPQDLAGHLESLYKFSVDAGLPNRLTAPIAKQAADIREKGAIGAFRTAQAGEIERKAQHSAAEEFGSVVQAAIESPQGYAQMRMLAAQNLDKLPPQLAQIVKNLPEDWRAAQKFLTPLATMSMKVKDRLAADDRAAKLAVDEEVAKSTIARNMASAGAAGARQVAIKTRTEAFVKNGGEGTPDAIAQKEQSWIAKEQKRRAERLVQYPRAPLDVSKMELGKRYTSADGWEGTVVRGPDGKLAFNGETPPPPKLGVPRTAAQIRAGVKVSVPGRVGTGDGGAGDDDEED